MVKAAEVSYNCSLQPVDIVPLEGPFSALHGSKSDIAVQDLWVDLGFLFVVSIVQERHVGVVFPLFGLIDSSAWRIDLDLLSEVRDLLALRKNINQVLHGSLAIQSKVDVDNLPLVFLDFGQLIDYLKFMSNDLFKMCG